MGTKKITKDEYYKNKFTKSQKQVLEILEKEDAYLANQVEKLFINYIIGVENFKTKIRTIFDS